MATIRLPPDFKDFLKLLNSEQVEYMLVGGYAVGYHGYPRATGDIDLWVARNPSNAEKLVRVLHQFGFSRSSLSADALLEENKVFRIGMPLLRIELLTDVTGLDFATCYPKRIAATIDGVELKVLSLSDLKQNKTACGRPKDLDDLLNLP
jgi:predicted nucleotidyltransferase